jgi:CHAT domain
LAQGADREAERLAQQQDPGKQAYRRETDLLTAELAGGASPLRLLSRHRSMRCAAARYGGETRANADYYTWELALHLWRVANRLPLARLVLAERLEHQPAWPFWPAALLSQRVPFWAIPFSVCQELIRRHRDWITCARWPTWTNDNPTRDSWRWRLNCLNVATDLARRDYDRAESFRLMGEMDAWRQDVQDISVGPTESTDVDYYRAQVALNVYSAFGLPDLAARKFEELERLAALRRQDPEKPPEDLLEDSFYLEQLRAVVWLPLDRHEDLIERVAALRQGPDYAQFSSAQRSELELLAALSSVELDLLEGRAHVPRPSPFAALLEPEVFSELGRYLQSTLLLHEASFHLERGSLGLFSERLSAWQALTANQELSGVETLQSLAVRVRGASLAVEASAGAEGAAEIERLELEFRALLDLWSDPSARASANALLSFHYASTCLTELALSRWRLRGHDGLAQALELDAAVQALGALGVRLGLDPRQPVDPWQLLQGRPGLVLSYFRGVHRSLVIWGSSTGLEAELLPGGDALDRERMALEGALARLMRTNGLAGWRELEGPRQRLGDQLIPDRLRQRLLAAAQAEERVALVSPGQLGFLPFEVLELAPGRPLGLEVALEYWPSFGVEAYLRQRPVDQTRAGALLLTRTFAVPAGLPSAESFELPERALAPWREQLANLQLLREEDANVDSLAQAARDREVCWLVAHGAYDPSRSIAAGLVLPRGNGDHPLLTVESPLWSGSPGWPELRLPPLVVLAACGAWRGPQRRGDDGSESLTARCFEAGARSVLLSYHELRFSDHARLATGLLEQWTGPAGQGGAGIAQSLLAARRRAVAMAKDPLGRLAPLLFHAYGGEVTSPRLERRPWPLIARLRNRLEPRQWLGLGLFSLGLGILARYYLPARRRRTG